MRQRAREREKTRLSFASHFPLLSPSSSDAKRTERPWCLRYANASSRFPSKLHCNTHIRWSKIIMLYGKIIGSYKKRKSSSRRENSLAGEDSVFLSCMIVHLMSCLNGCESPSRCTYKKNSISFFFSLLFVAILYSIFYTHKKPLQLYE
jgi:hypothetical protein